MRGLEEEAMRLLNYKRRPRVMVVAHGHPYQRDPFMRMFDAFPEVEPFIVGMKPS